MTNIDSMPKAEMASHLAEVIDSQDQKILRLHQQQQILVIALGILATWSLLF